MPELMKFLIKRKRVWCTVFFVRFALYKHGVIGSLFSTKMNIFFLLNFVFASTSTISDAPAATIIIIIIRITTTVFMLYRETNLS